MKNNKKKDVEKDLINKIKNDVYSKKISIIIAIVWITIAFVLAIIIHFTTNNSLIYSFMTCFAIIFCISIIWFCFRKGFLEKTIWKFYNFRNKKIFSNLDIKNNENNLSFEEYKIKNRNKDFLGVLILFILSLVSLIILLIINYL